MKLADPENANKSYYWRNRDSELEKRRERYKKRSTEQIIYYRAKARANRDGIPFNIEISDIVVPSVCPALGIPLKRNEGGKGQGDGSPSLDRIIPELGYTKGNVQVISSRANVLKQNLTPDQLYMFCSWVMDIKDTDL